MGTALDYGGGSAPLPWKLQLGAAATLQFSPRHRLEATAEGGYRLRPSGNRSLSGGVGAGYTFARLATVRAGYHFGDQEKELPGTRPSDAVSISIISIWMPPIGSAAPTPRYATPGCCRCGSTWGGEAGRDPGRNTDPDAPT